MTRDRRAGAPAPAIIQMTRGLTLFTIGSGLTPAAETALVGSLETPLTLLWVWLAFGETVAPKALGGSVIVIIAVVGHALLQSRRQASPQGAP
jgi:drug/metabolite transporter (DMT)-like permease